MKSFIENAMNRSLADSDTEAVIKDKRHKKKSKYQQEKDAKYE
jgi:hypothetical protein